MNRTTWINTNHNGRILKVLKNTESGTFTATTRLLYSKMEWFLTNIADEETAKSLATTLHINHSASLRRIK